LSGMGFNDKLPGDLPIGLKIVGSPAPVNNCGGSLTALPGTQLIKLENGVLGLNAACTVVVHVTGDIQGSYINTIDAGSLISNEGATNHDSTSDTLTVTGKTPSEGGGGGNGNSGKPKPPSSTVNGFLIPVTGFAPDVSTQLGAARPLYDGLGMTIEIPVLHVNTPIVGVQITDGSWDVSWLQDQLGWLNGTAYPTWKGNSVLTGHAVNADGKPGVFSRLKYLKTGELIFIYNGGYRYIYQVVSNDRVAPDDVSAFRHQDMTYLTLITCDNYDEASQAYQMRIAVHAKLVEVKPVQ
jgi:LPXTG-site transpeptidase (sortase) family protein